jgi:hypothetical protein
MHVVDTSKRGLHHCVFEIVDNSIDQGLAGYCTTSRLNLHLNGSCSVENDGHRILTGNHEKYQTAVSASVLFLSDESDFPWMAKLLGMDSTPDDSRFGCINCYHRREEIDPAHQTILLARELPLTEVVDNCPMDSILGEIMVYSDPSPLGALVHARPKLDTKEFFCNRGSIYLL